MLNRYKSNDDMQSYCHDQSEKILYEAKQLCSIQQQDIAQFSPVEEVGPKGSILTYIFLEILNHTQSPGANQLFRFTPQAVDIQSTTIPRNSLVVLHSRSLEETSESLDPARFALPDAPRLHSESLAPFSLGPRRCPGEKIAEYVFKVIFSCMELEADRHRQQLKENFAPSYSL